MERKREIYNSEEKPLHAWRAKEPNVCSMETAETVEVTLTEGENPAESLD